MNRVNYLNQPLPDNFRRQEITEILAIVHLGECLQLIAPSGSGKTLLVGQINSQKHPGITSIYLDFNLLVDKSPQKAADYLETALIAKMVSKTAKQPDQPNKTMIIIDHFENILEPTMKDFLNYLKGRYNVSRPNLSYIFVTEKQLLSGNLLYLSGNLSTILTENIYTLPPLSQTDVDWIIKTTADYYQVKLTTDDKTEIIFQTKGYIRLIKYLIQAVSKGLTVSQLITDPSADSHLATFMSQISQSYETSSNLSLPPIFGHYINKPPIPKSTNQNQKTIEEKLGLTNHFTKSEDIIVTLLLNYPSTLVPRHEVAQAIWGKDTEPDYTDHALDQLISRLNKKLKLANPPVSITTLRGRGYRLSIG